jgi:membrane protease YdiL (CAAX protease family)
LAEHEGKTLTIPTEYHSPLNSEEPTPIEQPVPAKPSMLRKVFLGVDGLRAGWSLFLFIAMFAALAFCANRIGHKLHAPDPSSAKPGYEISPLFGVVAEAIPFLMIVFLTWIMSKIERRPMSVYGLGDSRKLSHFLAGLAWGIVCLSVLILTLLKSGFLVIERRLLFGGDILRYGALWLLGFLLVGLLEEYMTRGYVQYTLTRGLAGMYRWAFKTPHSKVLGFWTSALIFSILFGLGHGKNPGESPIGLLSAGLAGMVFCLSLWRTGSLWWAIGLHTSWDWGQSFLYGVADSGIMVQHHLLATHPVGKPILSGGTTGPEGSIFILGVLALITVIIFFTLPRTPYGRAAKAFE